VSKYILYNSIILGILIIFLSNSHVSVSFDKEDTVYIKLLGLPQKGICKDKNDTIKLIQQVVKVISNFGTLEPLPFGEIKNLKSFYNYKKGICFDRSIVYEKIFSYYGFKTYHYFLAFNDNLVKTIFSRTTISHTLVSVMVGKDEVFIDTNNYFVSVDFDNKPISNFIKKVSTDNFGSPALWWNVYFKKYRYSLIIRGMYSRNGDFFESLIKTPEFNFFDFKLIL